MFFAKSKVEVKAPRAAKGTISLLLSATNGLLANYRDQYAHFCSGPAPARSAPRPRPPRNPPRPLTAPRMPRPCMLRMMAIIIAIGLAPRMLKPPRFMPGLFLRFGFTVSWRPLNNDSFRCLALSALSLLANSM